MKHWLSSHEEEKGQPEFIFRKISSYKDCLSRQIAEAILIHYSKDNLLNSKNEYNSNCLARVTVEENVYERKRRERKEEEDSLQEKKAWNVFKWNRGAGKRRKEPDLPEERMGRDGKKPRLEPNLHVERLCIRAGNFRKRLEKDNQRVI